MGTIAVLGPAIVSGIISFGEEFLKDLKGGAKPSTDPKHDDKAATPPTAKAIAEKPEFKQAVAKQHINSAANAAASAIPNKISFSQSKALSDCAAKAEELSTQLDIIARQLASCYGAEDGAFGVSQMLANKKNVDDDDQDLLSTWWNKVDESIVTISQVDIAKLTDQATAEALTKLLDTHEEQQYRDFGEWLKNNIKTPVPHEWLEFSKTLWQLLDNATKIGQKAMEQDSSDLTKLAAQLREMGTQKPAPGEDSHDGK